MNDESPQVEDSLPPATPEQAQFSEKIQDLTQHLQEQGFLLGYRNGYREGQLVQDLLQWLREEQGEADISQDRLDTLRDVEYFLSSNGAFIEEDGETTYPPGLNIYTGAADGRPHIQVAGERIHIEDFDFRWEPAADAPDDADSGFEPQDGTGKITIEADLELPEDTDRREALVQFLQGLR